MSDKMTVEQAMEKLRFAFPPAKGWTQEGASPALLDLISAIRADEKSKVNERWQLVWDAEVRKMEVYDAKIRAEERAKADARWEAIIKAAGSQRWEQIGLMSQTDYRCARQDEIQALTAAINEAKAHP